MERSHETKERDFWDSAEAQGIAGAMADSST